MLEIQPSWGAQLDLDLQQHREQLHLRGPKELLPVGRLRLDYQSLSPGYHALLWLSLQVRALKKGRQNYNFSLPHSTLVGKSPGIKNVSEAM